MSFIYMIIMGLIVGVIARAIKPGADAMGWILTIVLGIIGALVGGFLSRYARYECQWWLYRSNFLSHWRHYCAIRL